MLGYSANLLIALALGFVCCYLGKQSEGVLRLIGYAIGTFIIAYAAIIILVNAFLFSCPVFGKSGKMMLPRQQMQTPMQK